MTPEREHELETNEDTALTLAEQREGWHFCREFDGLLTQGEQRDADGSCAFCHFDGSKVTADIFATQVLRGENGNFVWPSLPPAAIVHVLRHGVTLCSPVRTKIEPSHFGEGAFWVGFTEPRERLTACPRTKQCFDCFEKLKEFATTEQLEAAARLRRCRVCACTDADCSQCIEATGVPCSWVEVDLCSRCFNAQRRLLTPEQVAAIAADAGLVPRGVELLSPANVEAEQVAELEAAGLVGPDRKTYPLSVLDGLFAEHTHDTPHGPAPAPPEVAIVILGVDPGLRNLGLFVLAVRSSGAECLHRETFHTERRTRVKSNGKAVTKRGDVARRLRECAQRLRHVAAKWKPDVIAYEVLGGVTVRKEQEGKGNADRAPLFAVVGAVEMLALVRGIPAYGVATMSARVAVLGHGKSRGATKKDARTGVERLTGVTKLTADQGDAGALAFGGYAAHIEATRPKRPPKKQRKA